MPIDPVDPNLDFTDPDDDRLMRRDDADDCPRPPAPDEPPVAKKDASTSALGDAARPDDAGSATTPDDGDGEGWRPPPRPTE